MTADRIRHAALPASAIVLSVVALIVATLYASGNQTAAQERVVIPGFTKGRELEVLKLTTIEWYVGRKEPGRITVTSNDGYGWIGVTIEYEDLAKPPEDYYFHASKIEWFRLGAETTNSKPSNEPSENKPAENQPRRPRGNDG